MYIATVPNRNSPPAILLRESYREEGKVKSRTVANVTNWKPDVVDAMRMALKGEFAAYGDPVSGAIFGVLFVLKQLADRLGISGALGKSQEALRVLFLVLARIDHAGSRLSAARWAKQHATEDILGLSTFDENDLYNALDWLAVKQDKVEQQLYLEHVKRTGHPPLLVLYDVTSSYFEGEENELAAHGYNRDKKSGKQQIVIGLLTADDGDPLAVRVFEGNTADPSTVAEQIRLLKDQFKIKDLVMVGDRGMIKAKGKLALEKEGWHYITAMTDAQIRTLLKNGILQADLFDSEIYEVEYDKKRLILRRNDSTRDREALRRNDKLTLLKKKIAARNTYVAEHPRAKAETGLNQLQNWVKNHKLAAFIAISLDEEGKISCVIDQSAMQSNALLDGCYCLETDLAREQMQATAVHARYGDLQKVERNFRTMKTGLLEVRPIFLRNAARTKAHVFVAMLALKIARAFETMLHQTLGTIATEADALTIDDALVALSRLTYLHYETNGQSITRLPRPDALQSSILSALGLTFPVGTPSLCRQ
jgi:transposase